MTLESLATDPSPFLEQDLEDLRKDNAVLQTELTNTQRKLFKAKQKIKQVSAGTKEKDKKIFAIGGRVLNFVTLSDKFSNARENINKHLSELSWNKGFYRKDIGHKVIDE